jgi:hypothetical protein
MIPPSLLSVSGWFMAVPVWRLDINTTDNPPPPQPQDGAQAGLDGAGAGDGASPPGICSQKWVFQGIEWRPAFFWDCLPNPAWSQWVDARDDAAQERVRREDRLRHDPDAAKPKPAAAEPPAPDGPGAEPHGD